MARSRFYEAARYVLTINNYNDDELAKVRELAGLPGCLVAVVGKEVGEQGTPHLQGYLEFVMPVKRTTLEAALGGRAWLQKAAGTRKQNLIYCRKGGDMVVDFSLNQKSPQEAGSKFARILHHAKTLTPVEFQQEEPESWVTRRSAIERIMLEEQADRAVPWDGDLPKKNVWVWGEAGIGKSRWASQQAPIAATYKKNLNKWWDGFLPLTHRNVIIEDWHPRADCLSAHLKIWADRYPFIAEVKGSSLTMEPGRWTLIITSNYPIEACFREEDRGAIKRRFSEIQITRENKALVLAARVTLE
jgi:hypothetical protein